MKAQSSCRELTFARVCGAALPTRQISALPLLPRHQKLLTVTPRAPSLLWCPTRVPYSVQFSHRNHTQRRNLQFQAVALYKNAVYATKLKKKKKKCIKKDLFISEIDKLVVVTAENQTTLLTKEK